MHRRCWPQTAPGTDLERLTGLSKRSREEVRALDKVKWSEAYTRLKIIDRVLFTYFGWGRLEANVEEALEVDILIIHSVQKTLPVWSVSS